MTVGAAVQSTTPPLMPLGTIAFLAMAAALGAGSGATFALVAQVAPVAKVGSVTGLVGAAGGLGGFVPPLVMGYVLRTHRLLRHRPRPARRRRRRDAAAHRDRGPVRGRGVPKPLPARVAAPAGRGRPRTRDTLMCEYCGCQEIAVIDELTREHDAVVRDLRRAPSPGRGVGASRGRGLPEDLGTPGAAHGGRGGGALPLPGWGVPRPRRRAARGTPLHRRRAGRGGLGTPEDPTWPARLLRTLEALREHILKEQDGVFPAALGALDSEEWERIEGVRARVGTALPPTLHHHGQA